MRSAVHVDDSGVGVDGAQPALVRTLRNCVVVAAVAHAASVILAPFVARYGLMQPAPRQRIAVINEVGRVLHAGLMGASVLDDPFVRAVAYLAPILLATGAFAAALRALGRERAVSDERVPRILGDGILAIAGIEVLRFPVMTIDFWLSMAWGRMAAGGVNPYYHAATAQSLRGLPLDAIATPMTYGPLWAVLTAVIAKITGSTVVTFLLHKFVLAAAWLGAAIFAFRLGTRTSPWHGAFALAIVGLLPASSLYAVGEGHNDALLACGAVGFLYYVACDRRWRAGLWLTAATLAKYVALPLAVLGLARLIGKPKEEWARAGFVAAGCAALAVLISVPFVRDLSFMSETIRMRTWEFLTPADALRSAAALSGVALPRGPLVGVFLAAFALLALRAIRRYVREPTERALASAALGVMAVVLFCALGHVWPWYVVWVIPIAACAFWDSLAVFVLLFAVAAPLLDLAWLLRDDNTLLAPLGLLVYAVALGGTLLLSKRHKVSITDAPRSGVVGGAAE
jgi:alpha-1,6-mannosyltransferase